MYGEIGGLWGRKGDLYEGGLCVFCLICYFKFIKLVFVFNEFVYGYDIFFILCKFLNIFFLNDCELDGIDIFFVFK